MGAVNEIAGENFHFDNFYDIQAEKSMNPHERTCTHRERCECLKRHKA